jgi:S-adenosylmethionine hydrolase
VLCPAAAKLASGAPLDGLGRSLEPGTLVRLEVPEPEVEPGKVRCTVVDVNRFGNILLNVRERDFASAGLESAPDIAVEAVSGAVRARRGTTYADFEPGEYGVIFDPRGWLNVVRGNPARAVEGLGLNLGDPVWLSGPAGMSDV